MKIARSARYKKDLKRLRVSPLEQQRLEQAVANDPQSGDVIPEMSGVRKIRFGFQGRGKRGGGRAIYYLMVTDDIAFMITAYAKNEKGDLSQGDKKAILAIIKELDND